jgi:hypothetical protein
MTFTEFLAKYNGKYVEVAGSPGAENQCVDLSNAYIRDVLGLPIIEWTNAIDFPSKADPSKYDYIKNTPTGVPQEGDIMIWGGTSYGHIGVFVEGDANTFRSFDQNYPLGSPAHIQGHTYSNVLGWLRPKQIVEEQTCQQELEKVRLERDANWTKFISVCEALGVGANVDVAVAEAKKLVELEDQYNQKDKQLTEAQTKIDDLGNKLVNLSFAQTELVADNEALKSKVVDYEKRIEEQGIEIGSLSSAIEELKKQVLTPVYKGWKKALVNLIGKLPF